jgi:hypothetical protein
MFDDVLLADREMLRPSQGKSERDRWHTTRSGEDGNGYTSRSDRISSPCQRNSSSAKNGRELEPTQVVGSQDGCVQKGRPSGQYLSHLCREPKAVVKMNRGLILAGRRYNINCSGLDTTPQPRREGSTNSAFPTTSTTSAPTLDFEPLHCHHQRQPPTYPPPAYFSFSVSYSTPSIRSLFVAVQ